MSGDEAADFALDRTDERVDAYLGALLGDSDVAVERRDDEWEVTAESADPTGIGPLDEALAAAPEGTIRLVDRDEGRVGRGAAGGDREDRDPDRDDLGPGEYERTGDGALVTAILDADAASAPVGHWRVADGVSDVPDPDWLAESPASVVDRSFRSYYTRRAVCLCFEASIETVSEFERDLLVPVAMDAETEARLPGLEAWFESVTAGPALDPERVVVGGGTASDESAGDGTASDESVGGGAAGGGVADDDRWPDAEEVADLLSAGREYAEEAVSSAVESVRRRATRAANVEFEEYADLKGERIEQLRDERQQLSERLDAIATELDEAADRSERLAALDERSAVRDEREAVAAELDALETARAEGFPVRRREIRARHSVAVELTATAATAVAYEKGDLVVSVRDEGRAGSYTVPYGRGVGVDGDAACDQCGSLLGAENPIRVTDAGPACRSCRE
ncbi:cell division protein ZapB [Halorussus salinus]|uniref:cell division protein ZapB n=1 Tax=Halorussus salinus TaxID=1364935 RepID=UPI0010920015|nr:cell division protein ZapB [Halorussus salinus]